MKLSKLLSTSILIVLALLLSGAKPASPASKNPRTKQDQDQSSSQQHLPDAQQSIASSLAGLAKIAESIHRDAKIAYRQYQSDQNSYSSPTMVVQIVLAVVGLLYVGTALLQWRAINQQAKLMQANFDQWIDLTNWRCAEKMHELKIWVDLVDPTAFPMKFTGFVAIAEDKQDLGEAVLLSPHSPKSMNFDISIPDNEYGRIVRPVTAQFSHWHKITKRRVTNDWSGTVECVWWGRDRTWHPTFTRFAARAER